MQTCSASQATPHFRTTSIPKESEDTRNELLASSLRPAFLFFGILLFPSGIPDIWLEGHCSSAKSHYLQGWFAFTLR